MRESLRLFPTVPRVPKLVGEDSLLPAMDDKGNRTEVFVPKGSTIILDLITLGSNRESSTLVRANGWTNIMQQQCTGELTLRRSNLNGSSTHQAGVGRVRLVRILL